MKENLIHIKKNPDLLPVTIELPSSKSESNRALILKNLADQETQLFNISSARDTQTMIRLLQSNDRELDVLDAGTTMRFLIAYLSVKNRDKILKGSRRMHERPVEILVTALRSLGAKIDYLENEGYPPLHIHGMPEQKQNHIKIRGDVSSQYISALLMIAPKLPQGLHLELEGKIGSKPYILMTLRLMERFGITYNWEGNMIHVAHQKFNPGHYTIESDWSGASYWFSMVALCQSGNIKLKGLRQDSMQGDIRIAEIMQNLGAKATFESTGVVLNKTTPSQNFEYDFSDCPDLAQTVAVTCMAKGIRGRFYGIESLRIKETDRIAALQNEMAKFHGRMEEESAGVWLIKPPKQFPLNEGSIRIHTYEDHRMAMALAPLATITDLTIEDPDVVNKSYPEFWNHLRHAGFQIKK